MTHIRQELGLQAACFLYPGLLGCQFTGGFLQAEGLDPEHSISAPGATAIAALVDGTADVVQSAPSQGISALERGETPPAMHFAQVNEMDGFFLTGRAADQRGIVSNNLRSKISPTG